jgi:hypothetical protein
VYCAGNYVHRRRSGISRHLAGFIGISRDLAAAQKIGGAQAH